MAAPRLGVDRDVHHVTDVGEHALGVQPDGLGVLLTETGRVSTVAMSSG